MAEKTEQPSEDAFTNPGLINIGQPPGIPERTDSDASYNSYIKKSMRVVDLIPLYFTFDVVKMFKDATEDTTVFNELIRLDYPSGIFEFQRKLQGIGHPMTNLIGARLWVTSSSSLTESVTNSYKPNAISSAYNEGREQLINNGLLDAARSISGGKLAPPGATGMLAGLFDVKQMSLPQIWESTDYNPSISFNVKLTSPYGDQESFKNNIVIPLLGLLALISPSSSDGVTYGLPPYLTVKAYGSMHMKLGIIENFTINRGGADTRFNAMKQPLEINIDLTFKQALPGFGAMIGDGGSTDIATVGDVDTPSGISGTGIGNNEAIPGIITLGSMIESLKPADPTVVAGAGVSNSNLFGALQDIGGLADAFTSGDITSVMDGLGVDLGSLNEGFSNLFDSSGIGGTIEDTLGSIFSG